jgi:hypothetical protein
MPGWEVLLAGFTSSGPELYFYEAHKGDELRLILDDAFAAGPQPSAETFVRCGYVPPSDMSDFDPVQHGIPIMEAFRRTSAPLHEGYPAIGYGVGGFIAHTLIERNRVTHNIIHEWPDVIGEPIDPKRKAA